MEKTKRVDTRENLPPSRVRQVGSWTEQFSSNGRRYFYNRETEVSQWDKPQAWLDAEHIIDPDLDNDDRMSYTSLGRYSDRCGSSPEKIDVSEDENSPMEEEIDEEEMKRRAVEQAKVEEEEKERLEKEREYNKLYGYRRYMDEDAMDRKYREMFGTDRQRRPYDKDNFPPHLQRRVDDLNFHVTYNEKMIECARAHRETQFCMLSAKFYEIKSAGLGDLTEELEESRRNFQANFETSMASIVAQAKVEPDFDPDDMKEEEDDWIDWPDENSIVRAHEAILSKRSDDYYRKRARFMELYKPKEPTPSPEPMEPMPASPSSRVIKDVKKEDELDVRSPAASFADDDDMEMVVSPVYDGDNYDPTARETTTYSTRASASSPSSSPEPLRTQEYTRPTSERPLSLLLPPPPAFPILDLEASEKKKRRRESHSPLRSPGSAGRSPPVSPVVSPLYEPKSPVIETPTGCRSPPSSSASRSRSRSPARSPLHVPVSPEPVQTARSPPLQSPIIEPIPPPPMHISVRSCAPFNVPPKPPPPAIPPTTTPLSTPVPLSSLATTPIPPSPLTTTVHPPTLTTPPNAPPSMKPPPPLTTPTNAPQNMKLNITPVKPPQPHVNPVLPPRHHSIHLHSMNPPPPPTLYTPPPPLHTPPKPPLSQFMNPPPNLGTPPKPPVPINTSYPPPSTLQRPPPPPFGTPAKPPMHPVMYDHSNVPIFDPSVPPPALPSFLPAYYSTPSTLPPPPPAPILEGMERKEYKLDSPF